ncbi:CU044_2847 family protein [Deinococcus sp.]|uniref:CU044_2847 family protein n=1 Tax=Deinococcus sp. TaxID=47478 RepID=UPI0025D931F7|nr:CU044_2847 family protein [Deinococcus sp.]
MDDSAPQHPDSADQNAPVQIQAAPVATPESYADRGGYDPSFLLVRVPMPDISGAVSRFGPATPLTGSTGAVASTELKYTHFSLVMSQVRRLAFVTAVNIDGASLFDYPRNRDVWHFDPRIPAAAQVDEFMYRNEPGPQGFFDRGHLVRRRDPIWGSGATLKAANDDTFHWTNCSPQYWEFNQGETLWQGLENFILSSAELGKVKVSVFTGPVFTDADPLHRQVQIPQQFWKVVAAVDEAGALRSSAYRVSQADFITPITFQSVPEVAAEALPVGPYSTFQVAVSEIESLTGLNFGDGLRGADVFTDQVPKRLARLSDARLPFGMGAGVSALNTQPSGRLGAELDDGQILYFGEAGESVGQVSALGNPLLDAGTSLQDALRRAMPTLRDIARTLGDINSPDELSLQLGLKITADASVILARLGTEGTLNVTLRWYNSEERRRP